MGLDYAFHSRHMDGLKSALAKSLGNLKSIPNAKAIFVSTVNPDQASGSLLDANYWWRNVREPVQFQAAVTKLAELGCRVFVEIGPDAVLQRYIRTSLSECGIKGRVLSTLRKKSDGLENLFETALRVHLIADKTDTGVFFPTTGKRVRLPNTPWQKERYWISSTSESLHALDRRRVHPLLGWQLPETETTWENVLDPVVLPWLSDHRVDGAIVFPGAAYAEMALAAAREWLKTEFPAVEELDMVSPLVFDDDHARTVRFILNPRDGGFQIKSRQRLSADPWTLHATGRIIEAFDRPSELLAELLAKPAGPVIQRVESNVHYQLTAKVGLEYGPAFQGLVCTRRDAHRLEGRLAEQMAPDAAYEIHPALLDPCFQALVDFFQSEIESGAGTAFLPVKIGRLQLYAKDRVAGFRAHLRGWNTRSALADFQLLGPEEKILATLTGCRFRAAVLRPANAPNPDIWRTVPYLTPHPAEHPNTALPASETLAGICRQALAGSGPGRWKWFRETLPLLEALALAFIHDAVRKLTEKDPDGVSRLVSAHSGYAWWLAELLVREGLVAHCENTWQLKSDRDFTDSIDIWRTLLHDAPTCFPQLTRMGRVGLHLPELLTGQVDSAAFLETLSRSSLTETVDSDPAGWGMQQAVAGILRHLAADIPANRRLRVLECTSTRPGPYSRLLQSLIQNDRLDYVVVLEDAAVRDRAQAEYRDGARITVGTLDLLHWTLSAEKVLPVCFDVIIMDQILHRAPDPFAAMEKTLGWIAPGGALLLVERHPDWSVDFVQGLDPSWWRPVPSPDDSSCDVSWRSSLCPPETWQKALQESGYDDVVCFTEPEAEGLAEGACLLIAKRPQHDVIHPLAALAAPPAHAWLLLAHGDAATFLAKRLKERLEAGGQQVQVTDALNTADPGNIHHVVWFSGWNHGVDEAPELLSRLLGDVQALGGWASTPPRLWIVTCGGALVSGPWGPAVASRAPNPAQTAIWGFGRVVMNEYPALGCRLVDIAGDPDAADMPARLEQELLYPDGADEIVLADTGRYTLEVTKEKKSDVAICGHPSPAELRFRLDFRVPGQLRNLLWLPEAEKPLAADQVEVRTHATGLNFRDVMFLMGLLPEEAVEKGFSGSSLGLEFSGIVTRTGAEVNTVCPGDAVMGFGPSAFASHVVTRADAVVPIPDGWSFESAATVPTVFFTAYYALVQLADLQPGERVLIHGAAGGVGMAAIQLARHRGAEIFATAGNAIKRDIVRLLGADQVFDSRSLAFEEEILTRTGGEGVDVVLNSLAGEAVRRNLNLLKPFGRFLELGKRDFVENTPIGLRPFKDNISYFAVDVDQLLIHRPRLAGQVLGEVMDLFRQGILSPLPWRGFSAKQVESAFRCMQQANHMGKVVVVFDSARPPVSFPVDAKPPVRLEPVCFEKDSTWLVTGGLSGFGLETARWLAAQGAGTVVLLGRRGTQSAEAVQAAEELAACGATLQIRACDVTDRAALAAILEEIRLSLPPLKGIVHAAMVMDDGLMANMDAQSLQAVLGPKLLGAWYLHTLTLDIPLDYFVLFSSITTLIGNPGQANYVAANAGLEGLCALRQQMELPVTCVGWGPIGDVGYLARHTAVRDSLCGRLGGAPLTSAEALDQLGAALLREDGPLAVARLDWNTLSRHLPSAGSPRFAALGRGRKQTPADNETADVRALIAGKTRDAALELVGALVVDEVAHILCLSPERINADRSLQDLGMDSLMAVELALALEKRFGILFPVMMLGESPSIQKVSVRIVDKLMGGEESASPDMLSAKLGDLAYHHGESVSPDQVKHILQDAQMTAEHDPIQEV
ncbi:SDR family NAD(P)-dependent oxidoreductase [Desulfosarcina sp. OttesenSCG-928-A07]|nr:SDR family NAD(P)-dependent oxidoreductase [Desulfosarcina sp. OttesenSCG-928-A07]